MISLRPAHGFLFLPLVLTLCLAAVAGSTRPAMAMSWQEATRTVERQSDELWDRAREEGFVGHLGTGLNELHVAEHQCAILGRMLGQTEAIRELETSTEIDTDAADPHTIALAAHSLGNWAFVARRLLDTDRERRIEIWNLDCAGQMGIPVQAAIAREGPATFYEVEGDILHVLGAIEEGFADRIVEALDSEPGIEIVALGSGGGLVREAIEAGLVIRRRGLSTTLWNDCYSACPLVFLGGVDRTIWSPYPDLAFHEASLDDAVVTGDAPVYATIASYAEAMGADGVTVVDFMRRADPATFYTPPLDALCRASIATWIQRGCSAP